jgi:hypothetical protein
VATSAGLCEPHGLAVNAAGDVFVAGALRVRRIDGATGIITTLAGDGARGARGDGGPASSAQLSMDLDVQVDGAGNVYVADDWRVRRLAADGGITTVAGAGEDAPATAARLDYAYGVAATPGGHLLVIDRHRIRRVDAATGTITTVAGIGIEGFAGDGGAARLARLSFPTAVGSDALGNLYISDTGNARVRRVAVGTGIITTVAGNGTTQFSGDGGPATSAGLTPSGLVVTTAGDLLVSDRWNHRIRRIDGLTGVITTVAGDGTDDFAGDDGPAIAASLYQPRGLALHSGDLYVADYGNSRVRRIDAVTGNITTVAGDGSYAGPDGGAATASGLGLVESVAIDAEGGLLIGAGQVARLRRVDPTTGLISTLAGTDVAGFSGDGGPANIAHIVHASAIAVSGSTVYIADGDNARIRRIGPSGIAPLTWTAPFAGGTTDITVGQAGSTAWTAVSNDAWLSVSVGDGVGSGTVTLTAAANIGATPRTGTATVAGQTVLVTQLADLPCWTVDRTELSFGTVRSGNSFVPATNPQWVRIVQTGAAAVSWTASSSAPWLTVSPGGLSGSSQLLVNVMPALGLPASGTVVGTITITPDGGNPVPPIVVRLTITPQSALRPAFGVIDTPANGTSGVVGAVAFTGWALDDLEVVGVAICRAAVTGETAPLDARCGNTRKVFIGDAVFIDGARPDVEISYPAYPLKTRAGWGLMVLTNMLPDIGAHQPSGGNGSFTFTFYATDADGHVTVLGARTIACANASSTLPFGTLDTPGQGVTVSGAGVLNFGWALTPQPKTIPFDGSTINVFVDGVPVGHPAYGHPRADIQALFPGLNNTDFGVGVHVLDSTALANGIHTIAWSVCDDAAACTGIGSRYFAVSNSALDAAPRRTAIPSAIAPVAGVGQLPADLWPVSGRRGWDLDAPFTPATVTAAGATLVDGEQADRFELDLALEPGETVSGYLRVGEQLRPMPTGAALDARTGRFTWTPGVGFIGRYDLVFVRSLEGHAVGRREVRVRIVSKRSGSAVVAPSASAAPPKKAGAR